MLRVLKYVDQTRLILLFRHRSMINVTNSNNNYFLSALSSLLRMCCYVVVVTIVSYINRSFEFRSWDAAGSDERRSYWSIVCLNLFLGFIYNSSVRELTNKSSRFSIKDEFWLMDLNKVVPCCYVRLISSSRFSVSLKIQQLYLFFTSARIMFGQFIAITIQTWKFFSQCYHSSHLRLTGHRLYCQGRDLWKSM